MNYIKSKKISLKNHPDFNEKWLQQTIKDDPKILGLGEDIEVRDVERRQPGGGRLDLLLKNSEENKLFTVELQLGECDPDHIIRTIEYWDIERKRYPQCEHAAVIIAEDITSRFWNVINLFNRTIPLIAIQLEARQIEDNITLNFIKVLDAIEFDIEIDEDKNSEPANRDYWESTSTPEILQMVDKLKQSLNNFDREIDLKYNKHYIGLHRNNAVDNFIKFRPYKKYLDIRVKKKNLKDQDINELENEGLIFDWKDRNNYLSYRIRISKNDLLQKNEAIVKLFKCAGGFDNTENIEPTA